MSRPRSPAPSAIRLLWAGLLLGCASSPWPDEPGVSVPLARADNVQAGDDFLAALTRRRTLANRPPPIVAARYQREIQVFAEDLQAGKTSAAGAQRAIAEWARGAYGRDVTTLSIDCAAGERMELPRKLVEMPSAAISYAAAHFRPRSLPGDQCAVLVVALVGSESITKMTP
jgi:hypothetical protein